MTPHETRDYIRLAFWQGHDPTEGMSVIERRILTERYKNHKTYKEIATLINKEPITIQHREAEAIKKLAYIGI
jgi:DNA-directed RNA polymerase specialized sigma subunit